jgi:hypothetical protein
LYQSYQSFSTSLAPAAKATTFDCAGRTTGDEPWLRYEYESDSMFAPSADMVLPRLRARFQMKKTMITVFFTATRLIILNSLPQA